MHTAHAYPTRSLDHRNGPWPSILIDAHRLRREQYDPYGFNSILTRLNKRFDSDKNIHRVYPIDILWLTRIR
jgi:hypothetical protein